MVIKQSSLIWTWVHNSQDLSLHRFYCMWNYCIILVGGNILESLSKRKNVWIFNCRIDDLQIHLMDIVSEIFPVFLSSSLKHPIVL